MTAESFVERPKTLAALREEIAAGRTKAADLAAGYYERIEKLNPRLNVYPEPHQRTRVRAGRAH